MSLYSLGRLARQRDYSKPVSVVGRPTSRKEASGTTPQTTIETLAAMIPSEALALYTAMLAVVLAEVKDGEEFMALRWALLVSFLILVPTYVFIDHWRGGRKTRTVPSAEMLSAFIAFAAWGLAMPGSPMHGALAGAEDRIATGLIVLASVAVLPFMGGVWLTKQWKPRGESKPPDEHMETASGGGAEQPKPPESAPSQQDMDDSYGDEE